MSKTRKRLESRASGKGSKLREKTAAFNAFIVAVTSLPHSVSADEVLEAYRLSRQVEIHFKRLKSILDFGDLPKKSGGFGGVANGNIMVDLLIEAFIAKASFSPATGSNTRRSIWRETALVHLVLRANPGLRILEDHQRIAKRLECEKQKRGIRYQMCHAC